MKRASTIPCKASKPSEALALGELAASLAEAERRTVIVACTWPQESILLGLYSSAPSTTTVPVYRRITGGNPARMRRGHGYAALAIHGVRRLGEAVSKARTLAQHLKATAYGATIIGGTGLIELALPRQPTLQELAEAIGAQSLETLEPSPKTVEELARRFEQPSWNLYRYRSLSVETLAAKPPYYMRISLELTDGYVTGWSIDSNIHAAPPMELHSILASMQGAPLTSIELAGVEAALEARLETHGLTVHDIASALRRLKDLAEAKGLI